MTRAIYPFSLTLLGLTLLGAVGTSARADDVADARSSNDYSNVIRGMIQNAESYSRQADLDDHAVKLRTELLEGLLKNKRVTREWLTIQSKEDADRIGQNDAQLAIEIPRQEEELKQLAVITQQLEAAKYKLRTDKATGDKKDQAYKALIKADERIVSELEGKRSALEGSTKRRMQKTIPELKESTVRLTVRNQLIAIIQGDAAQARFICAELKQLKKPGSKRIEDQKQVGLDLLCSEFKLVPVNMGNLESASDSTAAGGAAR